MIHHDKLNIYYFQTIRFILFLYYRITNKEGYESVKIKTLRFPRADFRRPSSNLYTKHKASKLPSLRRKVDSSSKLYTLLQNVEESPRVIKVIKQKVHLYVLDLAKLISIHFDTNLNNL